MPNRSPTNQAPEPTQEAPTRDYDERTSLYPLSPEEALSELLAVKPDDGGADTDNDNKD